MSILGSVTTGVARTGIRMVVAAQEKMGKTTIACGAPQALLVPLEVGYQGVSVAKTPMLQALEHVWQLFSEIGQACQAKQFPHRTVVLDSGTALERMIHDYVVRTSPEYIAAQDKKKALVSMETAHGGFGKAYPKANDIFQQLLAQLDVLAVYYGINIVVTCHVFSSKLIDPNVGEYDSWDLLLHSPKNNKTYGKREIITQWADVIGFLYDPIYLSSTEGSKMVRGISANKGRQLALSRTPSYTAGNRFGIVGAVPIPAPPVNGWNYFADALYKQTQGGIDVYTR